MNDGKIPNLNRYNPEEIARRQELFTAIDRNTCAYSDKAVSSLLNIPESERNDAIQDMTKVVREFVPVTRELLQVASKKEIDDGTRHTLDVYDAYSKFYSSLIFSILQRTPKREMEIPDEKYVNLCERIDQLKRADIEQRLYPAKTRTSNIDNYKKVIDEFAEVLLLYAEKFENITVAPLGNSGFATMVRQIAHQLDFQDRSAIEPDIYLDLLRSLLLIYETRFGNSSVVQPETPKTNYIFELRSGLLEERRLQEQLASINR